MTIRAVFEKGVFRPTEQVYQRPMSTTSSMRCFQWSN